MKKKNTANIPADDEMLPEYDLRQMRIVKRGPGHELRRQNGEPTQLVTVSLDPDVAQVFTTDQAVNEALRTFLRLMSSRRPLSEETQSLASQ